MMNDGLYFEFTNSLINRIEDLKILAANISGSPTTTEVDQQPEQQENNNNDMTLLILLDQQLTQLEKQVNDMKQYIQVYEKPYIPKVQELRILAEKQRDYLMFSLEPNINNNNNNNNNNNSNNNNTTISSNSEELEELEEVLEDCEEKGEPIQSNKNQKRRRNEQVVVVGELRQEEEEEEEQEKNKKKKKRTYFNHISQISDITEQELQKVPQYMKGRLTCNKINDCIASINQVLSKKYHLFTTLETTNDNHHHHHNNKNKQQVLQLKKQCERMENRQHFTEGELLTHSKFKLDTSGKLCLQVLRHVKRIRQDRRRVMPSGSGTSMKDSNSNGSSNEITYLVLSPDE